jgi:hypothetical protein
MRNFIGQSPERITGKCLAALIAILRCFAALFSIKDPQIKPDRLLLFYKIPAGENVYRELNCNKRDARVKYPLKAVRPCGTLTANRMPAGL